MYHDSVNFLLSTFISLKWINIDAATKGHLPKDESAKSDADAMSEVHLSKDESPKSDSEDSKTDEQRNVSETELSALDEILSVESGRLTSRFDGTGDGGSEEKKVLTSSHFEQGYVF